MTVFLRVLDAAIVDKPSELRRSIAAVRAGNGQFRQTVFERDPAAFSAVPRSPFAYWVSLRILNMFRVIRPFQGPNRIAASTNPLTEDSRYVRAWWEVSERKLGFALRPWAKGGPFSPFYCDIPTVIAWDPERSTYTGFLGGTSAWRRTRRHDEPGTIDVRPAEPPANYSHFLRPGLTWPRRTSGLSFRLLPKGSIFADKGPGIFVEGDDIHDLLALSALINSRAFAYLMGVQLARTELAQSYEVGLVQQTPVPVMGKHQRSILAALGRRAWSLTRSLDAADETSHAFLLPLSLNEQVTGFGRGACERELESIQRDIDEASFALYEIDPDDRTVIQASSKRVPSSDVLRRADADEPVAGGDTAADPDSDDEEEGEDSLCIDPGADAISSWLIGVAFGRFDLRLATGERAIPPDPEPVDPLPSRSPGMYPAGEEPVDRPDILVDDEGHTDDLVARARAVAERVKVEVPESLRGWLAREFFPLHIKMYSKSRRKAPIYWQLATPSASYSVWLYIHAFSKDTLFRVQNDYMTPKLAHEERRLESLTSELRNGATAAQRKSLATQEALVEELRAFLDEVKRVAPLWKPNLDDGVVINFAPLWRLVPQNKSWQKELKATWEALCEEKYDWAHLAMHLWPERVVPKCAKDRSLAIAHGLEDVFWVEGTDGKWTARRTPTRSVDDLVKERASPAVKSALRSLLEAPAASGKSAVRKGGGRREDAGAVSPDFASVAAGAWARPHTMERGEIQAALVAVLKANGAPMERRHGRLAALLCLEPHLLVPQLDAAEKKAWFHAVGGDAKKAATATIDNTTKEWGQALSGLRGRGRLDENLQQNTWALGTGIDAIDTNGWPEGRAGFVVNVLRRLQSSAPVDAIILKLPMPVQQWFANAA